MELWKLMLNNMQLFKRQNFWRISHTRQASTDSIIPTDLIISLDHQVNKAVDLNQAQAKTLLGLIQYHLLRSQAQSLVERAKVHLWVQKREEKGDLKKIWKMKFQTAAITTVETHHLPLFQTQTCFRQMDHFTKKYKS